LSSQEEFIDAAIEGEKAALLEALQKCDPAVKDKKGTPGDPAMLKVLLSAHDDSGSNALILAASYGHADCIEVLLDPKWCFDVDGQDDVRTHNTAQHRTTTHSEQAEAHRGLRAASTVSHAVPTRD
jgi:ankyrin repeat protein